ncbi:MAG: DUF2281 domain-containing protein [Phormidesmis sp.]
MTTENAILETVKDLPESIKLSVLLYTKFLASQYADQKTDEIEEPTHKKHTLAGSMKGLFVLPLPDDFDEPLAAFEEYL